MKIFPLSAIYFLSLFAQKAIAQEVNCCEQSVPVNWHAKDSKLMMSSSHYKDGSQSLEWKWEKAGATISIKDSAFASAANQPRSSFVLWVYSEKKLPGKLQFDFQKDGKTACSFTFNLDFTGWRTAWIMYNRDMSGKTVEGMDQLVIHSPAGIKKGSLYFDQLRYNININPRSPMRDEQVPFVNIHSDEAANSHWTALYSFSHKPNYLPLPDKITSAQTADLDTIFQRYESMLLPSGKATKISIPELQQAFQYWQIKRIKNHISGRPVFSVNDRELFLKNAPKAASESFDLSTIKPFSQLMLQIALAYRFADDPSQKKMLGQMFIDMIDHLADQGWAAGSGMGALHHLGYNFRDYYSACLLMKDVLKKENRFDETWKTMYWYSGLGRTQPKIGSPSDFNIDVFNTLLGSMLSTILIMDNGPAKLRQMEEFSNWLSQAMMPTYSIDGTFKPDGAVFHHANLYPAYGVGGLQSLAPIVYALSATSFQVTKTASASLKKVMLTMHKYTNPLYWPVDISGRHPTKSGKVPADMYAYMAIAGSPDGKEKLDTEMAAIYLNMVDKPNDKWVKEFRSAGIKPAPYFHGHWNLNYGLLDIHRRNDWLVTVRGHNRYFVSNETYEGANMYGRYGSYGQLDVTYPQSKENDGASFKDKGWDWNNIPGTTTLHFPLEKLRAEIKNVDDFTGVEEMLLTDQVFAGGTNFQNRQGMFSMILHGNAKYNMESFYAHKSYFMFDSLIVCLGSNISDDIKDYKTQTTLFQNYLEDKNAACYIDGNKIDSFPFGKRWNTTDDLSIIDSRNIGYYIPTDQQIQFTRQHQASRDQTDSHDTHGNLETLIIDHGNAPKGASYEYAMLIKTTPVAMQHFSTEMKNGNGPYKVLRKDSVEHSVYYSPENLTATALFNSNLYTGDSLILANNRPCLMMYEVSADSINMSLTDPDLAFYTGTDDAPRTPDGKRKEVSIYSKSWYKTPAQPTMIDLILKGQWKKAGANDRVGVTYLSGGNTQLSIPCEYGIASKFRLLRKTDN